MAKDAKAIYYVKTYQGVCHKCCKAYYYPGGDRFAGPEDKRPLECVLCGHGRKEVNG